MACSKPVLSFAAIVQGRDSSVWVTDDGLGDVVDVVMVVTGKNCNHSNGALLYQEWTLICQVFVMLCLITQNAFCMI